MRLSVFAELLKRVQHAHGLVEQYAAAARHGREQPLSIPLRRAFGQLKLDFLGAGMDSLSNLAASMEIAAGRGGSATQKVRILREGVGSMRQQIETEQQAIRGEAAARNDDGGGGS